MSSHRLGRVLTWQGVVLATAMAAIGLPAGILLGAVAWRTIADQLGVAANAVVPLWIALLLPAAIAAGVLASVLPARRLRRKDVATLLRAE
jgi:ABC-type antimicrobial peptide transport system permease subunit